MIKRWGETKAVLWCRNDFIKSRGEHALTLHFHKVLRWSRLHGAKWKTHIRITSSYHREVCYLHLDKSYLAKALRNQFISNASSWVKKRLFLMNVLPWTAQRIYASCQKQINYCTFCKVLTWIAEKLICKLGYFFKMAEERKKKHTKWGRVKMCGQRLQFCVCKHGLWK